MWSLLLLTSIGSPQKQWVRPSTACVGILQPAPHIAYFQAVAAR